MTFLQCHVPLKTRFILLALPLLASYADAGRRLVSGRRQSPEELNVARRERDIAARRERDNSSLRKAVEIGDAHAIKELLDQDADPNIKIRVGGTRVPALSVAVACANPGDSPECVRLLLKAGANVEATDHHGATPLIQAANDGQAAILKLLLTHNADPNSTDRQGRPAVMLAALNGHRRGHADCFSLLLDSGADLRPAVTLAALNGNTNCLRLLLDSGADPNSADRNGRPAVTLATSHGHAKCLSLLLDKDADPNSAYRDGGSAVTLAACLGYAKCLSLLLDKDADPNSAFRNGTPAVTLATMHGRAKCLSLLLDSGADPNIAMDNGSTALMYAAFSGDTDCAELLLRHEAQVDAIGTIRQRRGTALLHCGITMSSPYHGNNPLHVGRQQRSDAMALALLEYGADPDHQDISCDRARYVMDPERLHDRLEERDRAVKAAFIASSIMSAKCGDDVGSLLASFVVTPWIYSQIQRLNAAARATAHANRRRLAPCNAHHPAFQTLINDLQR